MKDVIDLLIAIGWICLIYGGPVSAIVDGLIRARRK
jgi:hypothetical protein